MQLGGCIGYIISFCHLLSLLTVSKYIFILADEVTIAILMSFHLPAYCCHIHPVYIYRSAIWVALAFMPLAACTWLFAVLSINSSSTDIQSYDYLFSVLACITAIYSLLAHVVFSKRVSHLALIVTSPVCVNLTCYMPFYIGTREFIS